MTISTEDWYAREADRMARGPQLYGGNAAIIELRCFKWYHPDSGSWLTAPDGRQRWFGPKTMRIYAILHRASASGGLITMKTIATEAMCSVSTVSRAVVRLQAFQFFAIDVKRGRNGGITVRLRKLGDDLRRYAEAAWARIRARINVASTLKEGMKGLLTREKELKKVTDSLLLDMDATFNEAWDDAEERGRLLAAETPSDAEIAAPGHARGAAAEADHEWANASEWAEQVILERQRLDREEPDWDLEIEKVRASYGLESRWPA